MIKILCDEEKAAMLFDSATRIYPEAIAAIAARSNYRARAVGPSLYRAKAASKREQRKILALEFSKHRNGRPRKAAILNRV